MKSVAYVLVVVLAFVAMDALRGTPAFAESTQTRASALSEYGPMSHRGAEPEKVSNADQASSPLAPDAWITIDDGRLPIVLSAPHGGEQQLPDVEPRSQGMIGRDIRTYEVALAVQSLLHDRLGHTPHLVAARAARAHVDFNRSPEEAYEDPTVEPLYAAYHDALDEAVGAARTQGGDCALLVDLHGHGRSADVIFRGTRDGQTADLDLLHRPGGFVAALLDEGLHIAPTEADAPEHRAYYGGFIVSTHGRDTGDQTPIDAVQLELGSGLRDEATLENTAETLADGLISHLQTHCPDVLADTQDASGLDGRVATAKMRSDAESDAPAAIRRAISGP